MNNRKTTGLILLCYLLWGFQPMYWFLMRDTDSMFLLMSRILWAGVSVLVILAIQHRLYQIKQVFHDRETMKHLVPATIFMMADWGIYMIAVQSGHILDTSLGYYIGPLVLMFFGITIFHEKINWQSIVAIAFVIVGIGVTAVAYKSFSFVTISLAFAFSIYAAFMKNVKIDSLLSTCVQLIMMAPVAILYILFFRMGDNGIAAVTLTSQLFLVGSGLVTVTPILIYASCVKRLPLVLMSITQYLCPTFALFCGIILGEDLTKERLVSFCFIWTGILVFSIASVIQDIRKKSALQKSALQKSALQKTAQC